MDRKTEKRIVLILITAALLSMIVTAVTLTLTQPTLTDTAIRVWRVTLDPAEYQPKININKASVSQIAMAEGIGDVTAKKIYDYIRTCGPISDLSQLDAVEGVGEKRLQELAKIFYAG